MSPQNNTSQSSLFNALFYPVLIIGALIVIAILVMSFTGNKRTVPSANENISQVNADTMDALRSTYDERAESIGHVDAPVTIREFGDYQCPACGQFESTAERLRNEYVDSGQVRFLFFDFPLPMHANAQAAAVAARCAARQDRFWPYHNRIYHAQSQWAGESDPRSTFLDLALETGLDTGQLKACMSSDEPVAHINAERDAGKAIQLRATPTVMVNDTMYTGGQSYDQMKQAIERALSRQDTSNDG